MVKESAVETEDDKLADISAKKRKGQLGKKKKDKSSPVDNDAWARPSYLYGSNNHEPGMGESVEEPDQMSPADVLSQARTTEYRSVVARGNFLSADRGDILYAVKECARCMSEPTERDWQKLVRLGRYLKSRPRLVIWYEYQEAPDQVRVYSDTDWAGCRRTRRSTTGGVAMHGSHLIKMWSRTQALVALSSAEAELYGIVKATAELKGLISLWKDLGIQLSGHLLADASAALGSATDDSQLEGTRVCVCVCWRAQRHG